MIGVVAHLGRQIKRYREPGLAALQQVAIAGVRFLRGGVASILAHRPEAAAVHVWLNTARVGRLAREAETAIGVPLGEIVRAVQRIDGDARRRLEALAALRRTFAGGLQRPLLPCR